MDGKGFSWTEFLTISVIIGILLVIAIPNFVSMRHDAVREKVSRHVESIRSAQIAYHQIHGEYVEVKEWTPMEQAGSQSHQWPSNSGFAALGWAPEGEVHGVYQVLVGVDGEPGFKVIGRCDVDGDGEHAQFSATQLTSTSRETGSGTY